MTVHQVSESSMCDARSKKTTTAILVRSIRWRCEAADAGHAFVQFHHIDALQYEHQPHDEPDGAH